MIDFFVYLIFAVIVMGFWGVVMYVHESIEEAIWKKKHKKTI